MRYTATIIIRCTKELKKAVEIWAKSAQMKPGEAVRETLQAAFAVKEQEPKLPPGVKRLKHKSGRTH